MEPFKKPPLEGLESILNAAQFMLSHKNDEFLH